MKAVLTTLAVLFVLLGTTHLTASGPLGIYGIVEKVVFEPNEQSPERIQVWGAFAYVENRALTVSKATRGYLYFKLPSLIPGFINQSQVDLVKTEWADLKAVAGTGQAIGFGSWGYIAGFGALQPDARPSGPSVILERVPRGGSAIDLRVRPATEPATLPATYQTNAGIVKLSDRGSHAATVKQLQAALKQTVATAFRLDIGRPIAGNAPKVKSAVLVVRTISCSEPAGARITGAAEGVVNGARRSVPLKLAPLEKPGVYSVNQEWPDGRWILNLTGTCGGATAAVLVPLRKQEFIRESSRFLAHAATATEIEASLNALAAPDARR